MPPDPLEEPLSEILDPRLFRILNKWCHRSRTQACILSTNGVLADWANPTEVDAWSINGVSAD